MAKKKPEIYRARATAAKWFGLYIRTRDCIDVMGGVEYGKCFTCDSVLPIAKLQCGHFMPGRKDSGMFDERNAAAQCYQCNVRKQGMWPEFERELTNKYGANVVAKIKANYFEDIAFLTDDYRRIADMFRGKYKALLKGLNDEKNV